MTKEIDVHDENVDKPIETRHTTDMFHENETRIEDHPTREAVQVNKRFPMFTDDYSDELCSRWNSLQAQFVDQPRASIEQADALIADLVQKIQQQITDQHTYLQNRWHGHEDASTEDLRLTLQDYRAFFNSLLND